MATSATANTALSHALPLSVETTHSVEATLPVETALSVETALPAETKERPARDSGAGGKRGKGSPGKSPAGKAGAAKAAAGTLTFVGVGPGDLGLLTVRAVEVLSVADAVVYDDGAMDNVVSHYVRKDAELIPANDPASGSAVTTAGRGKRLVKAVKEHRRVVRLLDGDGAMFAGLAEEATACQRAGLSFEIVPGVSSLSAAATYAGVSLTNQSVNSVHFAQATADIAKNVVAGKKVSNVITGSTAEIVSAAAELVSAGWNPQTPLVVSVDGTRVSQVSLQSTLADVKSALAALGRRRELGTRLVAVLGPGVEHRDELSWFETKQLFGWKVLVPRTKEQSSATIERLEDFGAVSTIVPTISVEPPRTPQQMEKAIKGLVTGRYEWVGFTSVNAVRAVKEKFTEFGLDARAFAGLRIAAVGGVTAQALRDWGIEPDLVPAGEQSARGLLNEWPAFDKVLDPINRVFLPRADIATDTLVAGLQEGGWEVDDVTAYRTVRASPPPVEVREAIKNGTFDAVLFTSSSTVRNLVGIAGKPHSTSVIACIGPATAKTAEEHGLRVDVMASEANAISLVETLAAFAASARQSALEAGEPALRPSQRKGSARRKAK